MAVQKINTRKFVVSFRQIQYPSAEWYVTDYFKGKTVSGGPIIALFYDKKLATEYAKFKNTKRDGKT